MISIRLNQSYTAIIDDQDADLASQRWFAKIGHTGRVYAARIDIVEGKRILRNMHRVILERALGRELTRNEQADHIDNDPLNNRRSNLRPATRSQNQFNARRRTDNTSGYRGVSFHKRSGKWSAYIATEGRTRHLGLFDTPEEAYQKRLEAIREYHGEFARD